MENNQHALPSPASESGLPALSPRKLAAQRANASASTGPRTPEGKDIARLNALKHGFYSCDVVNSELDGPARVEQFNALLDALLEEFQPQSVHERIMIDEVAACCWRIRRLLRYECRESWSDEDEFRRAGLDAFVLPSDYDIDKIVRYERLIKRNLYRALYTLERIRAARRHPAGSGTDSDGVERELLDENKF